MQDVEGVWRPPESPGEQIPIKIRLQLSIFLPHNSTELAAFFPHFWWHTLLGSPRARPSEFQSECYSSSVLFLMLQVNNVGTNVRKSTDGVQCR